MSRNAVSLCPTLLGAEQQNAQARPLPTHRSTCQNPACQHA
jgi:hypothetical protein